MSSPPNFFLDPNASFSMDGTGTLVKHKMADVLPQSGPFVIGRYLAPPPPTRMVKKELLYNPPKYEPKERIEDLATHKPRYPPSVNRHPVAPALLALAGAPTNTSISEQPQEYKPENTQPVPVPSMAWFNPDVHAWTSEMRNLVKAEFPELRDQSRLYATKFDSTVQDIKDMYGDDVLIKQVMDKMVARRNAIDTDLFGVVPAGLLALVWLEYVKKINDTGCYKLFKENLYDMGTTCVQGDTHRLLSILVALDRE